MLFRSGDSRWTVIFLILFLSLSVSLFFHHTVLLRLSLYLTLSFSSSHNHSFFSSAFTFLESPIGRFDSFVPFTDYSSEQGPRTKRSFLQIKLAQSYESSCYCPYLPHCHFLPRYVRAEFVSLHVSVLFTQHSFIFL